MLTIQVQTRRKRSGCNEIKFIHLARFIIYSSWRALVNYVYIFAQEISQNTDLFLVFEIINDVRGFTVECK